MLSDFIERCVERALPILRCRFGDGVRILHPRLVKDGIRCIVVRCDVQGAGPDVTSVILKQVKAGAEASRVSTDWASLSFLTDVPGTGDLAPRFYGGDAEHGLFAMEDLGQGRTLEDLFLGSDPAAAREALYALARQTGRPQARTVGREEEFARLLGALTGTASQDRRSEAERWVAGLRGFQEWCEATGCRLPREFEACCLWLGARIAFPEPFLAFTHGDPAPSNNHVADERVRLLDFEYGGFRHALYDITAWYVLCPLPEALVAGMSECYRAELSRTCAAARDEGLYQEAWASLCAYRALALLSWIPRAVLAADQPWVGEWTGRQAALSTLHRLSRVAVGQPKLAPVAEAALRLDAALRSRWPETVNLLPCWPALQAWESAGCSGTNA